MKQLGKFELASVKRTNASVKSSLKKLNSNKEKIAKLEEECVKLEQYIDMWETPIKALSGGYTSTEVLQMLESPIAETTDNVAVESTEFSTEETDNTKEVGDMPNYGNSENNNELTY